MKTDRQDKPVEVFVGTAWQAGMVKSLLENAEVEAFLQDFIFATLKPMWSVPGGIGSVKVFVLPKDIEIARQVVEEYNRNMIETSQTEDIGE